MEFRRSNILRKKILRNTFKSASVWYWKFFRFFFRFSKVFSVTNFSMVRSLNNVWLIRVSQMTFVKIYEHFFSFAFKLNLYLSVSKVKRIIVIFYASFNTTWLNWWSAVDKNFFSSLMDCLLLKLLFAQIMTNLIKISIDRFFIYLLLMEHGIIILKCFIWMD